MKYIGCHTNGPDHDPRTKFFAKYECEECNHVHSDVQTSGFRRGTFVAKTDMKCPSCGSYGITDKAKAQQIKDEIADLTQDKTQIEVKIDKLVRELADLVEPEDTSYIEKRQKSLLWNT